MLPSSPNLLYLPSQIAVVAAATTTWNPADMAADITLSGGNLVATAGSVSATKNLRAIANHSSGKFYFEVTPTVSVNGTTEIGIADASAALNNYLGSTLTTAMAAAGDGSGFGGGWGGFTANAITTFAVGDTIGIAADLTAQKIWINVIHSGTPGNWNNDVIGNQNPSNGTGGKTFSGISGPYYPVAGCAGANIGQVFTANFGGSAYAQTAPTGFGNW